MRPDEFQSGQSPFVPVDTIVGFSAGTLSAGEVIGMSRNLHVIEILLEANKKRNMSTKLFERMNDSEPPEFAELNRKVWSPTPFMIDVKMEGRQLEMRRWCYMKFGRESSPIHKQEGDWKQSNVTIKGYCWWGFKTEHLMNYFKDQFQITEKP